MSEPQLLPSTHAGALANAPRSSPPGTPRTAVQQSHWPVTRSARRSAIGRARLLLWHWMLTPGWTRQTVADRLRGWERVLDWQYAAAGKRLKLVRRALLTPARAWRDADDTVARLGGEIEAVSGVSRRAQHRQLLRLRLRHNLGEVSYLDYQLYLPERWAKAGEYVAEFEYYRLLRWLNAMDPESDARTLYDKDAFTAWCRRHDLPSAPTLAEYEDGVLIATTLAGDPASALPAADLFSKPADGTSGKGTERWRYMADVHGWMGRDGRARSAEELIAEIAHLSQTLELNRRGMSRRILLQPCIRNHRDLLPLTPGALCTVRIVTCRSAGGRAHTVRAVYKMATGDSPADNFCYGGTAAPVDLATGRLGPAVRRRGRVLVPVERHPDTDAVIEGHQIPHWAAAMAVAERGMDAARGLIQIGWDVAITDDGPVLIEGNPISNPDVGQIPSGVPLTDTPLPGYIEAHVREALGV